MNGIFVYNHTRMGKEEIEVWAINRRLTAG